MIDAKGAQNVDRMPPEQARDIAWAFFQAQARSARLDNTERDLFGPDFKLNASAPIDALSGRDAFIDRFLAPLHEAFPDLERRDAIFLVGEYKDGTWAASTGHYVGTFKRDWLGVPASYKATFLRYGEIISIEQGRVAASYVLFDLVDLARQAGVDLVPASLRADGVAPAPTTQDGIIRAPQPRSESDKSLALVNAMIAALMEYDQTSLESMRQETFWHPQMMWYGPAGIGAARGLSGFRTFHQKPFLEFVPNRKGGDHVARIAEGAYIATGGWPSISATTSGAPWIATPLPGGVDVTMRVMDFWRREGDLLRENWVFIDIPDVFRQCGVDLFARLSNP